MFIAVGALALLVDRLWNGWAPRSPRSHPFDLAVAAFLGWSALSVLWAHNRYEAVAAWLPWAACGIVYVLVSRSAAREGEGRWLLLALFASGAVVSLLGLAQHFLGLKALYQAVPPAATFVHKNIAAQFVVAVLPLGLPLAGSGRRGVVLAALGAAVMGVFVFHTLTRSAWMAGAAEAAVLGVLVIAGGRLRARRSALLASAAALVVLVVLTAVSARSRLGEAGERLADIWEAARPPAAAGGRERQPFTSVRHRQVIWMNTLAMARDAPLLGVGLGNHKVHYPAYARRAAVDRNVGAESQLDYAHNDYLQVLAELGVVGAGLAAWLVLAAFAACRRLLRRGSTPAVWPLAAAITVSLVGILVDALFSFPFERALPPLICAVHLGLLDRLLAPAGEVAAPRRAPWWAVCAAAAALLGVSVVGLRWIASDRHVLKMLGAEARADWPRLAAHARAARRLNPYRKEPVFSLGLAQLAQGQPAEARSAFDEVLRRYPHDMTALGNRALARAAAGDASGAVADFDRVLEIAPDDPRAREAAAGVHYRNALDGLRGGTRVEAEAGLRRALELGRDHAGAHKALGILLYDDPARRAEAAAHLHRALALNPNDRDAPRMRAMIQAGPVSPPPPTAPPRP